MRPGTNHLNRQMTLASKIYIEGHGLHTGKTVRLEIHPAPANTGIWFQRFDVVGAQPVAAQWSNVTSTELSTTIGSGNNKVSTIEHLMAAFVGLGVDNALVRVSAEEVPILDGSAAPFVRAIEKAGMVRQDAYRRQFVVKECFEVRVGERFVRIEPASRQKIICEIQFGSRAIGRQIFEFVPSRSAFLSLAQSRTFCHVKEVEAMRKAGLALGGSLENAVVVDDDSVLNEEGLRSRDEFVQHKLLDAIGDLGLLGGEIIGKITLHKAGHSLHAAFMNELMKRRSEFLSVVESIDFGVNDSADLSNRLAHVFG